ncbi:MAG TPA: acetylxylan esterase, partial [Armatimonadota bacterium]|nr:acetylxylan esterase [Armatimonadota bacterium]
LVLQVEDFDGPWRRQTNITGYVGTGFVTSNANADVASSTMSTTVNVERGGRHVVWTRGYTSSNSRRAFQVEIAGKKLAVTHSDATRRWAWERAGEVDLQAGEVSIVIRDADDGFESVDAIIIAQHEGFDPMAEERNWTVYRGENPPEADALRFNIEACCALAAERTDPESADEWAKRKKRVKKDLAKALGLSPLPKRTPLNAQMTGTSERDKYTIENVVFESRPGFFVTANLYVPKGLERPAPAVVVVPGHAMDDGKNYGLYQMAQIGLARMGFVVLGYDPIGQGERKLPGFSHNLGYSLLLVGWTNEGFITWDTMRAIDYLCTRPEVDARRIGLAGNSGGGENTFYATPLERRVRAAASFCFTCSYDQWIRHGGNHCICNHMPGIVRDMEQFEIIGLNAPRPFLIGNGADDPIFPIAGTRDTLRRAQAIYEFDGAADAVALIASDAGHGWSQELREACYGWLGHWLMGIGDGSPIPEESFEAEDPNSSDVLCLDGEGLPEGHETLITLAQARADELIAGHGPIPRTRHQRGDLRRNLWRVLGGKPKADPPSARAVGTFQHEGRAVERLAITTEAGNEVPAFLMWPAERGDACPAMIYLHEGGKIAARSSEFVRSVLDRGVAVLALDPRAIGEVAPSGDYNHVASDAIVLGRPLLAQHAWDVMQAAGYLRSLDGVDASRIGIHGYGPTGLIALLAGALDGKMSAVIAERTLASFRYAIEDSQPQPKWIFAPSILKVADIPHLAACVAPGRISFIEPVGYGGQVIESEAAESALDVIDIAFANAPQ